MRWGVLDRVDARLARRGPNLRAFVVGIVYFAVSAALMTPWSIYSEWWRETSYGRTSQPLGDFLGQGLLSIVISSLLGALFFVGVYALIRRAGRGVVGLVGRAHGGCAVSRSCSPRRSSSSRCSTTTSRCLRARCATPCW